MYYIEFPTATKLYKTCRQNTIRPSSRWFDIFEMHHNDQMQPIEFLRSPFGHLKIHGCFLSVFADLDINLLCCNHSVKTDMCDIDVYDHVLEQLKFCYKGFEEDDMVSIIWFSPVENI